MYYMVLNSDVKNIAVYTQWEGKWSFWDAIIKTIYLFLTTLSKAKFSIKAGVQMNAADIVL